MEIIRIRNSQRIPKIRMQAKACLYNYCLLQLVMFDPDADDLDLFT
jgi:hypothetical protein